MLVSETPGRLVDTYAPCTTVAQAAKTEPDKNHDPRHATWHGSLIGIIEREILRSVGLGNNPELTTGGVEGPYKRGAEMATKSSSTVGAAANR